MICAASTFLAIPAHARNARAPAIDAVARARAAMGGAALLARVRAIGWTGTARVMTAGRPLELGVETRIEPFTRARTDSWLIDEGRVEKRTLMIEGQQGFVVFKGRQVALPPAEAEHERQQFGIYGHMLLAGTALPRAAGIMSVRAGYPNALIAQGRDGMPAVAAYVIESPDATGTLRERFTFSGSITDQGLRWPRRIAMTRNGAAFSTLIIDELNVELSGT